MLRKFFNDEAGFVISAELTVILTLVICAVVVGGSAIRDSIVFELHDVSEAIGALNQSYRYLGIQQGGTGIAANPNHGQCGGSGYNDTNDVCDCDAVTLVSVGGKTDPSAGGSVDGN